MLNDFERVSCDHRCIGNYVGKIYMCHFGIKIQCVPGVLGRSLLLNSFNRGNIY